MISVIIPAHNYGKYILECLNSILNNNSVYEYRKKLGNELAKESHVEADIIVPVPDSGIPAAIGYAEKIGKNFEFGLIRNHYVGRTFIEPTQQIRDLGVKLKHNADRSLIKGKSVILIDDSIVRGTTSTKIVKMIYDAGARDVHLRISCPPIKYPDFYGIDMPKKKNLLAANNSLEAIRKILNVKTLAFLSIEGLYRAMGFKKRNPIYPQFTDHYFTGDYPIRPIDKTIKDSQLSLLSNISKS